MTFPEEMEVFSDGEVIRPGNLRSCTLRLLKRIFLKFLWQLGNVREVLATVLKSSCIVFVCIGVRGSAVVILNSVRTEET